MAKVLLIRPQQIHWHNEAKRVAAPIGLLSIAANLQNHGHEVNFIDATIEGYEQERQIKPNVFEYGVSQEDLEKRIAEFNPDYVGITSLHTYFWTQVKNAAAIVKKVKPKAIVVVGGHHSSGVAEWIMNNEKNIDFVVQGEGEEAFCDIIANRTINRGIIKAKLISELGKLENPAFNLLNPNSYIPEMSHFGKSRGKNFITSLVSRGCQYGCFYCTSTFIHGRSVRTYSIEQVQKQIEEIVKLGFEEYVVQDDNVLSFNSEFRKEFFNILRKSKLHWNLDGGLYYSNVTEDNIFELRENGCYRVFLPLENINLKIMHRFGKYRTLKNDKEQRQKIEQVIHWLNDYGIEFYSALMIGFPGETYDDLKNAVDFARYLKDKGAIGVTFHWIHPYPSTPFYNKSYSIIPDDRKWENAPEYYSLIKPVIPIRDCSLDDAEKFIDCKTFEINKTKLLNNSYEYEKRELRWEPIYLNSIC